MISEGAKTRFLLAHNTLMADREGVIEGCRHIQAAFSDCSSVDAEIIELQREIEVVTELSRKAIYQNACTAQDQDDFNERNSGYLERHRAARERMEALEAEWRTRIGKAKMLESFIHDIKKSPLPIEEFCDKLWVSVVDKVTVGKDGEMTFSFRNGSNVTIES